jgi:drug/metabolite transporter (DMT)-like permease
MIVASAACFTAIDTMIKYLGTRYSAPVLVWARWGVPALMITVLLGPKLRWGLVRTANLKLHLLRGAVLVLSSLCFFTALKFLPLAEATGINYVTPILVTLTAGWFLRERITRARWVFAAAGFIGMLLIVRPGGGMLQAAALLALGAAALNATFQILTRKLATEDLLVLIFYPSVVGGALMSLAVPFVDFATAYLTWDILLFVAIGAIGLLGHFLFIQAFQLAPASTIAPFTYMQLVWSTLAGWLTFGSFPDAWSLSGMIVIAASAVALTAYERWRAGLPDAEPAERDRQRNPVMMSMPGAGITEVNIESRGGVAASAQQLQAGESMAVPSVGGPPKLVIKTD